MSLKQKEDRGILGRWLSDAEAEGRYVTQEFAGIASELRELARKEADLGAAEVKEQAGIITRAAAFAGAGLYLAALAGVFLSLTIMFALATAVDIWVAALITMLILAALAGIALLVARSYAKKVSLKPRRFLASIQEDIRWAKSQMKFSAR